jgi:hypothetical protein
VFGTREIAAREIAEREIRERETISPVWDSREVAKRDQIPMGPTLFLVLSQVRRNVMEEACFHFYPLKLILYFTK